MDKAKQKHEDRQRDDGQVEFLTEFVLLICRISWGVEAIGVPTIHSVPLHGARTLWIEVVLWRTFWRLNHMFFASDIVPNPDALSIF